MILTVEQPRIDGYTAELMVGEMREHLRENTLDCAVDLSRVNFMDSTGLSCLVSLLKYVGPDRRMELCGLKPPVKRILRLTRLDNVFYTRQSVHEAEIARLARPKAT